MGNVCIDLSASFASKRIFTVLSIILFALVAPTGGATLGSPGSATVTINDDDGIPPPQIPAGNVSLYLTLFAGMTAYAVFNARRRGKAE